jgi:hypothetical protein
MSDGHKIETLPQFNFDKLASETNNLDFSHPKLHRIIISYTQKSQQFDSTWDIMNSVWNSAEGKLLPEETQSILTLTSYLFFVEGLYSLCVDVIIYNLIITEHADILDRDGAYVTEFSKLANVDLSKKRIFLERHGFSEVLVMINRNLRNAIAHHDFKIHKDGLIEYTTKKGVKKYLTRNVIFDMVGRILVLSGLIKYRRSVTIRKE